MNTSILVAGGTGNLGGRIIKSLLNKGASVRTIVRIGTDKEKVTQLEQQGVEVITVDTYSTEALVQACIGVSCVVSALQGLRDVIVDAQKALLDAAIAAGVPRFIPSDFSIDFTRLPAGENRNFDLRRAFHEHLDKASINATSIFNGAFAEVLMYGNPLLDLKSRTTGYWESPDWPIDFTTMDDTAAFTAAAALDPAAPAILHIASFRLSPNELATTAGEAMKTEFRPVHMGSLNELIAYNKRERAAHPEGENELYPTWQSTQYLQSMFSAQPEPLDNNRYPDMTWTSAQDFLIASTKTRSK